MTVVAVVAVVALLFLTIARPVQAQQEYSPHASGWVCYVPMAIGVKWENAKEPQARHASPYVGHERRFYPFPRYFLQVRNGITEITEKRPGVFLMEVVDEFVGVSCVRQGRM